MKLTAFIAALLLGSTASAQTAAPSQSDWTFALHGFVSMSGGFQTGTFAPSEGQQSLDSSTGRPMPHDAGSFTADVRQSRFNFSVQGPKVLAGATPKGVLEIDFFNGFGAGNYGDVSILPRMRLAYTELDWGAHKLQFGQQNDLVFAMAPTSLSHIAFPLGYFTGNIGWRRPGIFGFHTLKLNDDAKVEAAWEVGRAQWADAASAAGAGTVNNASGITLGEASSAPALEGRLTLAFKKFLTAFVGAHWNNIDTSGYGAAAAATVHPVIATVAANAGLKLNLVLPNSMGLVLQGTGFTGKNVAPLIANMTTGNFAFSLVPGTGAGSIGNGDVHTTGYWAQAGLNLTKELSLWGFYGQQKIKPSDFAQLAAADANAYMNTTTNLMAMYREGGVGFSLEWIHFDTKFGGAGTGAATGLQGIAVSRSNQYLASANYFF